MKCIRNDAAGQITFTFDNLEPVVFSVEKAHESMRDYAEMHGWEQRLRDNAAIPRKDAPNGTVTEAMRRDAVVQLVNHYESGAETWSLKSSAPKFNPAIQALAAKLGKSYDEARAWLANGTVDELRAM